MRTAERILRRLAEASGEVMFEQLLPALSELAAGEALPALRLRSAWSSTFVASLELAKQGDVTLVQGGDFAAIHVLPAAGRQIISGPVNCSCG